MKLGLIGLDTSHVSRFAEILNDPSHPHHIPDARIEIAYPGGSADLHASYSRLDRFTRELADKRGVRIVDSPEAVAEACDAILITSVDGRVHLAQFEKVAPYGKPVFVDKPFAVQSRDAERMFELAERHRVTLLSCSALRFSGALAEALAMTDRGPLFGADCFGPVELEPTNPGLFWYGIHEIEMLYAAMGPGCVSVAASCNDEHEFIVGKWADGRIGTVRGNRRGNDAYGALLHRERGTEYVDVFSYPKPYYALLLEEVVRMANSGVSPVAPAETLEIIRFIEAANRSRINGLTELIGLAEQEL